MVSAHQTLKNELQRKGNRESYYLLLYKQQCLASNTPYNPPTSVDESVAAKKARRQKTRMTKVIPWENRNFRITADGGTPTYAYWPVTLERGQTSWTMSYSTGYLSKRPGTPGTGSSAHAHLVVSDGKAVVNITRSK
mmetsp:Transcript_4716/g.8102  ORF Transcript_4716/g.8102 Transcript_4716/m.8102 type:complete len:137 (+) Transcript_4716:321-731(+)